MFHSLILASQATDTFFASPAGTVLKALLAALGVILIVFAAVRMISSFAKGQIGPAVKTFIGTAIAVVFLFRPELLVSLVETIGTLVETLFGSTEEIIDKNTGGGGSNG